jgi:hypothetical protein
VKEPYNIKNEEDYVKGPYNIRNREGYERGPTTTGMGKVY